MNVLGKSRRLVPDDTLAYNHGRKSATVRNLAATFLEMFLKILIFQGVARFFATGSTTFHSRCCSLTGNKMKNPMLANAVNGHHHDALGTHPLITSGHRACMLARRQSRALKILSESSKRYRHFFRPLLSRGQIKNCEAYCTSPDFPIAADAL